MLRNEQLLDGQLVEQLDEQHESLEDPRAVVELSRSRDSEPLNI